MKIACTLFLLAAFAMMLYTDIGQVASVSAGIDHARREAAGQVSGGQASLTLTIDEKDFASGKVSTTGKNEIRYEGKLYDIAEMSRANGKIILKVLHDEKEEGLLANLKEIVESWSDNPANNNTKQPSLKQIVVIKDFVPSARFIFNCHGPVTQVSCASLFTFTVESPLIAVLKSPPQIG